MNDLRSVRKSKGLTMEQLASLSGVSSKTISLYEHTPPKRPSRKVVDKLSQALQVAPDVLLGAIGTKGKQAIEPQEEMPTGTIELEDFQVVRILVLVEKELQTLRQAMIESSAIAKDHPALARSIDYLVADIELLEEIKKRLS